MCRWFSKKPKVEDPVIEQPVPMVDKPSPQPNISVNAITISLPGQTPFLSVELVGRLQWPEPDQVQVWAPSIPDTNSMDPTYDSGHHVVYLRPLSDANRDYLAGELRVGDIAVYDNGLARITHRVSRIGADDKGRWFRFKGDNRNTEDIYLVRDYHIMAIAVAIIY